MRRHSIRLAALSISLLGIATAVGTLRRLRRAAVSGLSMHPLLHPGDRLLVWRTHHLKPGDLAVVADPREPTRWVVKRVHATDAYGVTVQGDNAAASTDSRTYGPVPWAGVQGRPFYRYAPTSRVGPLPR